MDHLNRKAGRLHYVYILALTALLSLSACGLSSPSTTVDPQLAATVAVIQTQNGLPVTGGSNGGTAGIASISGTPMALPSTPGAGPVDTNQVPLIIVLDQDTSAGQVTLRTVISDGPGWAVIHATDQYGSAGEVIGYAPVKTGLNSNVQVPIDAHKATPILFAELHQDAGKIGTFEYPGPDQPVTHLGQPVLSAFLNSAGTVGMLDQLNSTATAIGNIESLPTLSAVGTASGGSAANAPAPRATPTPAFTATPTVFPTPAATTTLPPSVKAFNQRLNNGQVIINEVISPGNGWVVVYSSNNGQPGEVLGYTMVRNGVNENVRVSILPLSTSRTLIAMLHMDAGKPGVFEYPGPDQPVTVGQKLFWAQFNLLP